MDIDKLIAQMTLEEKASMCSGKNFWETQDIERLGIPSITLADGPYGLVKRLSDFSEVVPATCFPTSSAMSSSWDINLIYTIGKAIGEECQAENVNILLGPAINIQRSPLGGRYFEYFSEDPVLSGEIGTAFTKGVQSQGVGSCVKHYVANNQEYRRLIVNNIIDEQALNEIYLANFEIVIKKGNPWCVMAAYNKVNGVYCTENKYLLTDVLRNQWNFDGFVVSDWYAVDSIINSLQAGLDLEMPYSYGVNKKKIVEAVQNGTLDESVLDGAVRNILNIVFRAITKKKAGASYDKEKHHHLAREAARNCIVLLKNENNLLPLIKEKMKKKKLAIIGEYSKKPRYQGGGSANVTPTILENAYDEILKLTENSIKIYYSKGYNITKESVPNENTLIDDNFLINEAKRVASRSDVVILFVGTPESYDREGSDRSDINLPDNQVKLIKEIGRIQRNLIVVLSNGSPVIISPWYKYANSIVEAWLTGQGSGGAIADILFGIANPSGKLSSTFPINLPNNPTYLDYVSPENNLEYKEGIFVGYRYYDKKAMEVQFPFGFGLSYTSFSYSDLNLSKDILEDTDTLEVKVKIKNTGMYFGKEVVQLYVREILSNVPRPIKELKSFTKVSLNSGEEKEVSFILNKRDFSHYDIITKSWIVASGPFQILIGKSSRDICLIKDIYVKSSYVPKIKYTRNTLTEDFLLHPNAKTFVETLLTDAAQSIATDDKIKNLFIEFFRALPISRFLVISKGRFTEKMLDELLELVN